jgi:hypothetical protein
MGAATPTPAGVGRVSEPIPMGYAKGTCLLGQGERCCAFLGFGTEFLCFKGTEVEAEIRRRLEAGTMTAKGDNCRGWEVERLLGAVAE